MSNPAPNPLAPLGISGSPDAKSFAIFRIANLAFAVPVPKVREVIAPIEVTPIPLAPAGWIGLANIRGRAVAVISLLPWLNQSTMSVQSEVPLNQEVWVVLNLPSVGDVALIANRFDSIQKIADQEPVVSPGQSRVLTQLQKLRPLVQSVWNLSLQRDVPVEVLALNLEQLIETMRIPEFPAFSVVAAESQ